MDFGRGRRITSGHGLCASPLGAASRRQRQRRPGHGVRIRPRMAKIHARRRGALRAGASGRLPLLFRHLPLAPDRPRRRRRRRRLRQRTMGGAGRAAGRAAPRLRSERRGARGGASEPRGSRQRRIPPGRRRQPADRRRQPRLRLLPRRPAPYSRPGARALRHRPQAQARRAAPRLHLLRVRQPAALVSPALAGEQRGAPRDRPPAVPAAGRNDRVDRAAGWPLARAGALLDRIGALPRGWPLAYYRHRSFYYMRTDSFDRFCTRLEHRFTRAAIERMLAQAGCGQIVFSSHEPFWCAAAIREPAGCS